jgi:hypothetical protein
MKKRVAAINRVVSTIDWKKIKSFHTKLGIRWEFNVDKETVNRVPTIPELKEELVSILHHMADNSLGYISYGNWIVFWSHEPFEEIRVIFRLADFSFEDTKVSKENLEDALKKALDSEDYEYAAVIRDEIKSQNANHNI